MRENERDAYREDGPHREGAQRDEVQRGTERSSQKPQRK